MRLRRSQSPSPPSVSATLGTTGSPDELVLRVRVAGASPPHTIEYWRAGAWLRAHNGYTPTNDFEESALDSVSSLLSPGAVRWPKDGMHTKNDLNWTVLRDYLSAKPPRVVIANVLHGHHFVLTVGLSGDGDTILVNDPGFDKTNYSYSKDVVGWRIFDMTN